MTYRIDLHAERDGKGRITGTTTWDGTRAQALAMASALVRERGGSAVVKPVRKRKPNPRPKRARRNPGALSVAELREADAMLRAYHGKRTASHKWDEARSLLMGLGIDPATDTVISSTLADKLFPWVSSADTGYAVASNGSVRRPVKIAHVAALADDLERRADHPDAYRVPAKDVRKLRTYAKALRKALYAGPRSNPCPCQAAHPDEG